jgi:hypothetical protein
MYEQPTVWVCRARHTPCPVKELEVEAATPAEAREKFLAENLEVCKSRKLSGPELGRLVEAWAAAGGLAAVVVTRPGSDLPEADAPSGFAAVKVGGSVEVNLEPPAQTQAVSERRPRRRQTQTPHVEPAGPPPTEEEMMRVTV